MQDTQPNFVDKSAPYNYTPVEPSPYVPLDFNEHHPDMFTALLAAAYAHGDMGYSSLVDYY